MFIAWRMQDFESAIDVCERRNTCYDCSNEKCWRHGDKGADCPKYRCDNQNGYDCDNCEFIDEYIEYICSANTCYMCDDYVILIMNEELQPYYEHQKELDDVMPIIENRVNNMVDEQH